MHWVCHVDFSQCSRQHLAHTQVCQVAACALVRRPPGSLLPHAGAVAEAIALAGDIAINELDIAIKASKERTNVPLLSDE
eukprot:7846-Eustigmatos_ZCMA.PRE.1